jgi:hypothetical protein
MKDTVMYDCHAYLHNIDEMNKKIANGEAYDRTRVANLILSGYIRYDRIDYNYAWRYAIGPMSDLSWYWYSFGCG